MEVTLSVDDVSRKPDTTDHERGDDQNGGDEGNADDRTPSPIATIEVAVTFGRLNDNDRHTLREYGHGDKAYFRRSWSSDGTEKMIGRAMQAPRFTEIRQQSKVQDMKKIYKEVSPIIEFDISTPGAVVYRCDPTPVYATPASAAHCRVKKVERVENRTPPEFVVNPLVTVTTKTRIATGIGIASTIAGDPVFGTTNHLL